MAHDNTSSVLLKEGIQGPPLGSGSFRMGSRLAFGLGLPSGRLVRCGRSRSDRWRRGSGQRGASRGGGGGGRGVGLLEVQGKVVVTVLGHIPGQHPVATVLAGHQVLVVRAGSSVPRKRRRSIVQTQLYAQLLTIRWAGGSLRVLLCLKA